jgi:hypothetical protein
MSRKTITERIRRAKTNDARTELISQWLDDWKDEQTKLCERLSLAIDIHDFDEACIVNGQLRAVTDKKFVALYNMLHVLGMPEQTMPEGEICNWGKYQTALVAIMGRHIANNNWDEIYNIYVKFEKINTHNFVRTKNIIAYKLKA